MRKTRLVKANPKQAGPELLEECSMKRRLARISPGSNEPKTVKHSGVKRAAQNQKVGFQSEHGSSKDNDPKHTAKHTDWLNTKHGAFWKDPPGALI